LAAITHRVFLVVQRRLPPQLALFAQICHHARATRNATASTAHKAGATPIREVACAKRTLTARALTARTDAVMAMKTASRAKRTLIV
jgi:hypothetical protein